MENFLVTLTLAGTDEGPKRSLTCRVVIWVIWRVDAHRRNSINFYFTLRSFTNLAQ